MMKLFENCLNMLATERIPYPDNNSLLSELPRVNMLCCSACGLILPQPCDSASLSGLGMACLKVISLQEHLRKLGKWLLYSVLRNSDVAMSEIATSRTREQNCLWVKPVEFRGYNDRIHIRWNYTWLDTHRLRINFPCRWFRFSLRTWATAALTWAEGEHTGAAWAEPEQSLSGAWARLESACTHHNVEPTSAFCAPATVSSPNFARDSVFAPSRVSARSLLPKSTWLAIRMLGYSGLFWPRYKSWDFITWWLTHPSPLLPTAACCFVKGY